MPEITREILVFAKAPEPGFCKTRLGRRIGYPRAARVYRELLTHAVSIASSQRGTPAILSCAPDSSHPFLRGLAREYGLTTSRQTPGDLGRRMYAGLRDALGRADQVVLIGADCPALNAEHIADAFRSLDNGHQMVYSPAFDGGFVLVGATATEARIFHGVNWGSSDVMRQTRTRLARLGLSWQELGSLPDLDEFEDYRQARRDGRL